MQGYKETKRVWDDLCGKVGTGAIFACDRVISELRLLIVEGGDVTRLVRGRDDDDGRDVVELAASVEALHSKIRPHPKHLHSKPPYHACFPQSTSASAIESHLQSLGVVVPHWRYTMYSTSHFHSTAHEVLCIAAGCANLCFGGEDNPGRVVTEIKKGDVVIIPAGVAHRLLEDLDGGFLMVGSYPKGKSWDMCYGGEDERNKIDRIKDMGWFAKDPIYGDEGPVLALS